ncbi:MAG: DUF348 domain-containing protein [Firmicutes bacterium]|nr:DUF348 domain-containing protein [Bacillota bacterium]
MSKKTKKSRKKNQLSKKEIDAMVQEVLDEASKEAADKAPEQPVQENEPIVAEAETVLQEAPEAATKAVEAADKAEEPAADKAEVLAEEKPAVSESKAAKSKSKKSKSAKSKSAKSAVPVPDAQPEAGPAAEEPPAAEPKAEEPAATEPVETTGINDQDATLPKAGEDIPEPTGSKSVFLTAKEDGKLAIAANKDGEIIYEDNIIPPKPTFFSRFKKYIIASAAIALLVAGWFAYDYLFPKEITVVINSLENSRTMTQSVACTDVAGALEKMGITLSDIDEVHPFLTRRAESGMKIEVTRHLKALANVDGKNRDILLIPGTVADNLAFNEIEYDDDDIVSPLPTDPMTSDTKIVVKDVVVVVKEEEKTIASGSKVILDPSLGSGVYSATDAQEGKALYSYTTTYVNGESTGTTEEFKKWVTEPQDDTIRLGTSVTGQSGEVVIKWTFTSNTTAYYMGENAYGASGGHCHYGTCAVDPSVIPYGSILWVSGYGFAVANDCGGAIVGTNLDLYMRSTEECYSWGRRYVTAYLLGWA